VKTERIRTDSSETVFVTIFFRIQNRSGLYTDRIWSEYGSVADKDFVGSLVDNNVKLPFKFSTYVNIYSYKSNLCLAWWCLCTIGKKCITLFYLLSPVTYSTAHCRIFYRILSGYNREIWYIFKYGRILVKPYPFLYPLITSRIRDRIWQLSNRIYFCLP
jgi:hypothetical protein